MRGDAHRQLAGAPLTRAVSLDPPQLGLPAAGAGVQANPEFTWAPVAYARKYRIQVSTTSAFTSSTWAADVFGTTATPTTELPLGSLHWRVASLDGGGVVGPFSPSRSFTNTQADAPQLIAPASGATLSHPTDAAVLSWQPAPGMKQYKVEIDDKSTFTGAMSYTTSGTSFALPAALASNTQRYWRVQGIATTAAVTTAWSDSTDLRSFAIAWAPTSAPNPIAPADVPEPRQRGRRREGRVRTPRRACGSDLAARRERGIDAAEDLDVV